ncbi:bzip transcription factor [Ophiostoma piceae UAMH 11346]|uniref:Bzip transcription factor n=1 Tax=Ophiostoma piceae (strain UAMH 11346) TaxID=1262450 RepID=S3BQH3_OPHP1|nr:bzip transcription factor [Ophiostoma piceae UAMH 11346]
MASNHTISGYAAPIPGRQLRNQAGQNYFTPQHRILSTSTPMQPHRLPITTLPSTVPSAMPSTLSSATPLPTPPLTAGFASDFSLPLPPSTPAAYSGFGTSDGFDDVFGTASANVDFGLDMEMDMELEMEMDLARLTRDALPLFRPSTPLKPFTPATAYPALPEATGSRAASLGMSRLNLSTSNNGYSGDGNDDLFGGRDVFFSGDAAMSSPAVSHTGTAVREQSSQGPQTQTYKYPDPVSYASMPPVSAAAAPTPPLLPPPMPFTLPMPTYVPPRPRYGDHLDSPADSPSRRRGLRHEKSMPNLRSPSQAHSQTKIDPNDWRARLRYCEQAPNKSLLEAGMVRLLEFSDTMDERELAERRAANLRFDKIREQRLKDRNNEAAKRSRQRKVARIEAAEQQIASLRRERAQLVSEVASLRRRLASGSAVVTPGQPTGARKLRPSRSMAAKASSRMGDSIEEDISMRGD